jgi:hypothetical protein
MRRPWLLWVLFGLSLVLTLRAAATYREGFDSSGRVAGVSLTEMSTQALDAAPTASEAKIHYKTLLVYAAADIKNKGTNGLRLLADFRDRVFTQPGVTYDMRLPDGTYPKMNFRKTLTVNDFLDNWPTWMPALDPTIREPVPTVTDAVHAESKLLAFLQRYYPSGGDVQTQQVVRGLIEDFAYRFVYDRDTQQYQLVPDITSRSLLENWVNPVMKKYSSE